VDRGSASIHRFARARSMRMSTKVGAVHVGGVDSVVVVAVGLGRGRLADTLAA
jgi:hypothetical protein